LERRKRKRGKRRRFLFEKENGFVRAQMPCSPLSREKFNELNLFCANKLENKLGAVELCVLKSPDEILFI
jgi:hypothetical protein